MKFPFVMIIPAILITVFLVFSIRSVFIQMSENAKYEKQLKEQGYESIEEYQGFQIVKNTPFANFKLSHLFNKEFILVFFVIPLLLLIRIIYLAINREKFGDIFDETLLSTAITSFILGILGILAKIIGF